MDINQCTKCIIGYGINNGICIACSVNNCGECPSSSSICTTCRDSVPEYYLR